MRLPVPAGLFLASVSGTSVYQFRKLGVKFVSNTLHVTDLQTQPLKRAVFTDFKDKSTWIKIHPTPGTTEEKNPRAGCHPSGHTVAEARAGGSATGDAPILWVTGLGVSPPDPTKNFFTELKEHRFARETNANSVRHTPGTAAAGCVDLEAAGYRGAKKTSQKEVGRTGNEREER